MFILLILLVGNVACFSNNGLANNLNMNCFTEGTQIVVGMEYDADGNFVCYVTANIEDIEVGDLVYSYNTTTGETELCEVTDTFVRCSDHINYLTITDEHGHEQTIETTDGHPFWVVTDEPDLDRAARDYSDGMYHGNLEVTENGYWVEAKDLRVGDVFLGANGELSVLVDSVRVEFDGNITVYNFSVDANHDYFVIAEGDYGQTCVLVHNAGRWYHGTDADSAEDILRNGLDKSKMPVDAKNGFYVSDRPSFAQSYADLHENGKIVQFSDSDIGKLLKGDGTKEYEAFIPFEAFDQVKPGMIKPYNP